MITNVYGYAKIVAPVGRISYGIAKYVAFNPTSAPAAVCAIGLLMAKIAGCVFAKMLR